jgi:hypothetical protein
MSPADATNGFFEAFGALMVLNHVRVILRDRNVAGVSIVSVGFFTSWGFWNLYYYPSLHQWFSFAGGLVLVSANAAWVALAVRFRRRRSA